MSRTVNSEWLFEEADRELLRTLIWSVAEFCGVEVITYAILSNHFHLLVRIPERRPVADAEVLRRYCALYSRSPHFRSEIVTMLELEIRAKSETGIAWLAKQHRQMGDLSQFMKLLKQRFTGYFNARHKRHGTLWSERFKSVLVEDGHALRTMAAYIDLNAVRGGMATDPKDYRYCGYAEAVAGNVVARRGVNAITGLSEWEESGAAYRQDLFGSGANPLHKGEKISAGAFEEVMKAKGKLPLHVLLRCRLRYFTDSGVVGSSGFVARELEKQRRKYGRVNGLQPKMLPPIADWGPITLLRRCSAGICIS